jgi:hypothetical protein
MEVKMVAKLYKTLSRNDTGETHSHQSGISIPASVAKSGIFPLLGIEKLNPRVPIDFTDEDGKEWTFQYIYYNDQFFGKPARQSHNEHRLTCVKDYISENGIHSGDRIWFGIDENNNRYIGFEREANPNITEVDGTTVIKLSANWHYVKF